MPATAAKGLAPLAAQRRGDGMGDAAC